MSVKIKYYNGEFTEIPANTCENCDYWYNKAKAYELGLKFYKRRSSILWVICFFVAVLVGGVIICK